MMKCPRCEATMVRIAKSNLVKCKKCEKVIYVNFERRSQVPLFKTSSPKSL